MLQLTGANEIASVWFTDPPYYDAIPMQICLIFLSWLKRILHSYPLLLNTFDPCAELSPNVRK